MLNKVTFQKTMKNLILNTINNAMGFVRTLHLHKWIPFKYIAVYSDSKFQHFDRYCICLKCGKEKIKQVKGFLK